NHYEWNFGDNTNSVTGENPTHIFTDPGQYEVSLLAYNDDCATNFSKTITVTSGLATGTLSVKDGSMNIYGFGSTIYLRFDLKQETEAVVSIFNILGQEKISTSIEASGTVEFAMDSPEKVYLVRVIVNDKTYVRKVILSL